VRQSARGTFQEFHVYPVVERADIPHSWNGNIEKIMRNHGFRIPAFPEMGFVNGVRDQMCVAVQFFHPVEHMLPAANTISL
jgi:hypothetical protein